MIALKNLFIPSRTNNYTPYATRAISLFAFAVFIFGSNFALGKVNIASGQNSIDANEIVNLHNQERRSRGIGELSMNSNLNRAAQAKAEAMLKSDCWSHYCPNGKSPWDFFDDAGYVYVYAGENLAQGFYDNESVMLAWMNSPTHKDNVLKSQFNEIGIGIAYGKFQGIENNIVVAVHFGSRNTNLVDNSQPDSTSTNGGVKITFPRNGEYINEKRVEIIGEAEGNYVEVAINDNPQGESQIRDGIFTFRSPNELEDGTHFVQAKSYDNNENIISISDKTRFNIDTVLPGIDGKLLAKGASVGTKPIYIVQLTTTEPLSNGSVSIGNALIQLRQVTALKWEVDLEESSLESNKLFKLVLVDLSGNNSTFDYSTLDIVGIEDAKLEVENLKVQKSALSPFGALFDKLTQNPLIIQINLVIIVVIALMVGIDMYALKKTGLTAFKGKPHLHLISLIILVVVILVGGINGFILTGESI